MRHEPPIWAGIAQGGVDYWEKKRFSPEPVCSINILQSADKTGDAVETFPLPVSTFHCIRFFEVYTFSYPAFHAVGKRRRFYKRSSDPEFPAMDAEPAVLSRFFFIWKTLHLTPAYGQYPIVVNGHTNSLSFLLRSYHTRIHIKPENNDGKKALALKHPGTKTIP